jgi:hypothetical protein
MSHPSGVKLHTETPQFLVCQCKLLRDGPLALPAAVSLKSDALCVPRHWRKLLCLCTFHAININNCAMGMPKPFPCSLVTRCGYDSTNNVIANCKSPCCVRLWSPCIMESTTSPLQERLRAAGTIQGSAPLDTEHSTMMATPFLNSWDIY